MNNERVELIGTELVETPEASYHPLLDLPQGVKVVLHELEIPTTGPERVMRAYVERHYAIR